MSLTYIGFFLVFVGFFAFFRGRNALAYLIVFFLPFTATAVVNIEKPSFGLQPSFLFSILFIFRFFIDSLFNTRLFHFSKKISLNAFLLSFLLIISLISIFLIPFYDICYVNRPSGDFEILKISSQNFTQFSYLIFAIVIFFAIVKTNFKYETYNNILFIFFISSFFVALWGWFQIFCFKSDIIYPDYLFNNSYSFKQLYAQELSFLPIKRMNSVTPEASMMAKFMLMPAFSTYFIYRRNKKIHYLILSSFFMITLVATTSSTAIIAMPFCFLFVETLLDQYTDVKFIYTFLKFFLIIIFFLIFITGSVFILLKISGLSSDFIFNVLKNLIIEKLFSTSGEERLTSSLKSFILFYDHFLFGVGFGSNRSHELFSNILSNIGSLGTFLYFYFIFYNLKKLYKNSYKYEFTKFFFVILVVRFLTKFISDPDIVTLDYWVIMAIGLSHISYHTNCPFRLNAISKELA